MRTVYYVASTVDGFIAEADGSVTFLEELGPPDPAPYQAFYDGVDGLIMGRRTFDQVLGFGAWPYAGKPTWILSHRPIPLRDDDEPITGIAGAPQEVHAQIADAGVENLWLVGGGSLACQWLDAGLLDCIIVSYVPVALGHGVRLFGDLVRQVTLKRQQVVERANGFVEVTYFPST